MRVLLSAFACGPGLGSEEGIGWNWAVETARLGHDVTVLTETKDQAAVERALASGLAPPGLRFEFFMPERLRALWNLGMRLGFESLTAHLIHLLWQHAAYRHVRDVMGAEHFDVVHHITYGGIRHPTFMGRLSVPLVLGPLGGGERAPLALRRGLPFGGWLKDLVRDAHTALVRFDPVTRRACNDALVTYVKTPQSRSVLPRRDWARIAVEMEVGIHDVAPAAPERGPGRPFRLLFAGRFLYWKGMHLGLRGLQRYLARGGEARLTMVGKGPNEAVWRQLAKDLEVEHAIAWRAWVPHGQMPDLYREHDAFLFPSLHDSSGNAVLESLSHGLPVICLDLGGPAVIATPQCGRIVATGGRSEPACAEAIADAIGELATASGAWQAASAAARERASDFLWPERVATVYADIERRLADLPRHQRAAP